MNQGFGRGWLIATSLAFTLAAFGCSSNRMYGNGQPTTVTPTMNSTDHATTPGSSGGTNPPMASSYTYPSSSSDSSMYPTNQVDVDALATQAAQRGFRGVVLGPSGADGVQQGVTIAGGVYVSPALITNPAQTINSSISSPGGGGAITGGPIVPTSASAGVTLATSNNAAISTATTLGTSTTGALTTSTGAGSPILAGSSAFSPVLMNSTPAPQATGTTNPTLPTVVAAGSALTNGAPTTNTTSATSALRTGTSTRATTSALRTVGSATMTAVAPSISIQTNATGGIMVTNVGSALSSAGAHH